ncbi:MAG TPA: hypothetical protein VKB69_10045, partial [Micromonosporaceae bacterium]|nr:hypothetical protein [Micromonosporaceae bacterium]
WVVVTGPRRLATGADLAATVVFATLAILYQHGTALLVVLAVIAGVLRAVGDQSHASIITPPPEPGADPQPPVPVPVALVCGVAAGAVVGWLDVVSVVWLAALAFAISAAITIWQTPRLAPALSASAESARLAVVGDLVTQELRTYRPVRLRRVSLRSAAIAAVVDAATQAGAFGLVALWVRDVVQDPATLGFVGGAFVVGAFAGSVAGQMRQRALITCAAIGAGFALAVAPGMVTSNVPVMVVPIALAAFVAGAVFTTSVPVREVVVGYPGGSPEQLISETLSSVLAYLLAPFAVLLAAVVYENWTRVGGLLTAGLLYLVGVGVPMLTRPERPAGAAGPDEPTKALEPTHPRYAGITTWIAVTLVYTDGAWTVEVEHKDGVKEGTHDVRPADALRAIDLLDVPGVREEVEKAITDDQARAEKEAQRLRDELGGVGAKLTAINEMVELSDLWHTTS